MNLCDLAQYNHSMDLSVIVLSFNTYEVTINTLQSLKRSLTRSKKSYEVIAVDNASSDGSGDGIQQMKQQWASLIFIQNKTNEGFSRGNNIGLKVARGRHILFLNSDMIVDDLDIDPLIDYLDNYEDIGAITVRVQLKHGEIDPAAHRGFPTPSRSLMYFLGLEKLSRLGKVFAFWFGGYHLRHLDLSTRHEIECCTAAFLLVRGELIRELRGFDERFFMYGEDVDLCYRIRERGAKIVWWPAQKVTHLKYTSGVGSPDEATRRRIRHHFYNAMWLFYEKHYRARYPWFVTKLVQMGIDWMQKRRA
jgi:GT2 family glycosyltransferase